MSQRSCEESVSTYIAADVTFSTSATIIAVARPRSMAASLQLLIDVYNHHHH